jgi:hypothetical protein
MKLSLTEYFKPFKEWKKGLLRPNLASILPENGAVERFIISIRKLDSDTDLGAQKPAIT